MGVWFRASLWPEASALFSAGNPLPMLQGVPHGAIGGSSLVLRGVTIKTTEADLRKSNLAFLYGKLFSNLLTFCSIVSRSKAVTQGGLVTVSQ